MPNSKSSPLQRAARKRLNIRDEPVGIEGKAKPRQMTRRARVPSYSRQVRKPNSQKEWKPTPGSTYDKGVWRTKTGRSYAAGKYEDSTPVPYNTGRDKKAI